MQTIAEPEVIQSEIKINGFKDFVKNAEYDFIQHNIDRQSGGYNRKVKYHLKD